MPNVTIRVLEWESESRRELGRDATLLVLKMEEGHCEPGNTEDL